MATYQSPGVYVVEVPSAVKPIAGVGTSTAAFVGIVGAVEVAPAAPALRGRTLMRAFTASPGTVLNAESIDAVGRLLPTVDVHVQSADDPHKDTAMKPALLKPGMILSKDLTVPAVADFALTDPTWPADKLESLATFVRATGTKAVRVKPRLPLAGTRKSTAPVLCTSFGQFTRLFCDFVGVGAGDAFIEAQNQLTHAVYGFFNNGGSRAWVVAVEPTMTDGKPDDAKTAGDVIAALDALKALDDISLVAVPGAHRADVQEALLSHCENEHLRDRFAILDGPADDKEPAVRRSSFAALYYPWIEVSDPATGGTVMIPPSGHVAGVFARVDTQRGVHKAPANEPIRGALGVKKLLSKHDQAGLNPKGINVIRQFDGTVTIWGARTWAAPGEPEWTYVSARRLFIFLEASLRRGTAWAVFEPNDRSLWAKITRNVTAFLTGIWRDGALFGASPQEAFYVRCDDETNPPDARAQGRVVIEVGVALTKPAEFVIFRIGQQTGPAT